MGIYTTLKAMKLFWNDDRVSKPLASALRTLSKEYPLAEGGGPEQLVFESGDPTTCVMRREGQRMTITGGTTATQLRAVGAALAGLDDGAGRWVPTSECMMTTDMTYWTQLLPKNYHVIVSGFHFSGLPPELMPSRMPSILVYYNGTGSWQNGVKWGY